MESWERTVEMIKACARHQGGARMLVGEVNQVEYYVKRAPVLHTPSDRGLADHRPISHWDHSDWQ